MCAPSDEMVLLVCVLVAITGIVVGGRCGVSVILGQPVDCTSLHIGELFFTVSIAVSNELILLIGSKLY